MTPTPVSKAAEDADYTDAEIDNLFSYHFHQESSAALDPRIDKAAKAFAYAIRKACPEGPEQAQALEHVLRSAVCANNAIACS